MSAPLTSKGGSVTPDAGSQSHHPDNVLNTVLAGTGIKGVLLNAADVLGSNRSPYSDHILDIGSDNPSEEKAAMAKALKRGDAIDTKHTPPLTPLVL